MVKLNPFYVIVFFVILLQSNLLYSQISIKGNLKNSNRDPIEYASIQLLFDSEYNQSTLTDSSGNFSIKTFEKGEFELLINCLGYLSVRNELNIRNDTTINFVLQHDTIFLKEVTITGQEKLIQAKSDGFVINIKGNILTSGKETVEILKHLPTLSISDESLNIFGKSSVIVYINERIVRLDGRTLMSYLNSLPTDIIKSIEIISTPPAQYDAAGNVGIIRIITDKNILPGLKEYFRVGYLKNTYSSHSLSCNISHSGKKMFFEGTISNGSFTYLNQSEYRCYFPNQTINTYNPKKWNYSNAQIQATLGYNFNQKSMITLDCQVPLLNKETIDDIENYTSYINPINNHIDSTIYSKGQTTKDRNTYNTEIFFKHKFSDKKSYFTANTAYLYNNDLNIRPFSSLTQINNSKLITDNYFSKGNQNYNIFTSMLDFTFTCLNLEANAGLKLSFLKTTSDNKFFTIVKDNEHPWMYNHFDYSEDIQSVYCSLEKKFSKWSFKSGLRAELTNTISKSIIYDGANKNSYIDFFPSLYISHKSNNGSVLTISYASRIDRPPYQYLNPFRWYISKYDYAVGNPFLKPSYFKSIELSFNKNSFSTKIYYINQTDKIGQYVVLDSLNILNQIQQSDNFMNEYRYGINVYKFLKMNSWLETSIQGDISYSEFLSNKKEFSHLYGLGSILTINNTIILNKNFQFLINIEENIPGLYNYRSMKNYFCTDASLNYINNKYHFGVRLFVGDMFKSANPEYFYISGGVKQIYQNYNDTRYLKIVISWKPGNWFNKPPEKITPSNTDEQNRL
ncbi:MAG: outer membrane beta-barrel protein [Ignavibacteriales bacterium]|jgi:hypothetical protein